MKGVASYILIALGIVLILAAILWWAIAVNALVKLPDDVNVVNKYEGEVTYYVDPSTGEPLAPGSELKLPLAVEQDIISDAGEYDSSTGVLKEVFKTEVMGMAQDDVENSYVLDRGSMENKNDDQGRSYAFKTASFEGEEMERKGSYYPLFPIDSSKDEDYKFWKNEINESVETEFVEEKELEGVTVYSYRIVFENMEVTEGYIDQMQLPKETTLEELKPVLQAAGVDVDGFLALAGQVMDAADLQALSAALQEGIPLTYFWSMDQELSIEPKTGTPVDLYKNLETLSMRVDAAGLQETLLGILAKYADDPALGPAIAQLGEVQAQLEEDQRVFDQSYTMIEESRKTSIDDSKDYAGQINLVKVYIPWALLIVGAFLLIIGLLIGGGQAVPEKAEE